MEDNEKIKIMAPGKKHPAILKLNEYLTDEITDIVMKLKEKKLIKDDAQSIVNISAIILEGFLNGSELFLKNHIKISG